MAIGGDGEVLWNSISNYVSVVDRNNAQKSVSEDDPQCKSKGVTNEGIIRSARWKAAVSGAMLALNTANSLKMAKLQRDIGKAYQELAEDPRQYYNDRYKPLEISLTQEALNL